MSPVSWSVGASAVADDHEDDDDDKEKEEEEEEDIPFFVASLPLRNV
jgi:hypothetical protein